MSYLLSLGTITFGYINFRFLDVESDGVLRVKAFGDHWSDFLDFVFPNSFADILTLNVNREDISKFILLRGIDSIGTENLLINLFLL